MKTMRKISARNRKLISEHRGFSLVETVVALALFASASYVICTTCYNCIYPLDMKNKDSDVDFFKDWATQKILALSDYDALDDGITVETLGGDSSSVTAEAEPTKILDLFKIDITADSDAGFTEVAYAIRPSSWYEISSERADLIEDIKDEIKDRRDLVSNATSDDNGRREVYSLPISTLVDDEHKGCAFTAFVRISEREDSNSKDKVERSAETENGETEKKSSEFIKSGIELLMEKARASVDSTVLRDSLGIGSGTSSSVSKSTSKSSVSAGPSSRGISR